jgi:hypothetical protein
MQRFGWSSGALLLVRLPCMGYGIMTPEDYRKAGPFASLVTVLAMLPSQHEKEIKSLLPDGEADRLTAVVGRRS